jgi:hypothetical protein
MGILKASLGSNTTQGRAYFRKDGYKRENHHRKLAHFAALGPYREAV